MNITSCNYPNLSQDNLSLQMYSNNITDHHHHHQNRNQDQDQDHTTSHQLHHDQVNNILSSGVASSLLYSLSILKDKVHQLQSLLAIMLSQETAATTTTTTTTEPSSSSPSVALATMNMHNTIQEIIMTSSSMLLTIQHQTGPIIAPSSGNPNNPNPSNVVSSRSILGQQALIYPSTTSSDHQQTTIDWASPFFDRDDDNDHQNFNHNNNSTTTKIIKDNVKYNVNDINGSSNDMIIELDAADLLAKYTHYCQVCGKGFKRDANLRMHMRAHGDEYKTSAALSNPGKNKGYSRSPPPETTTITKRYSCPQEGCRWNRRHAKFQPLKSMICAKNHYKRSHCPKMYVCKRCNRKQFSVLSDLRTHEKHCGDLKWQCSCGTTFSRKDKLMGHVSLFHGHAPIVTMINNNSSSASNNSIISASTNNSTSILHNRIAKIESQVLSSHLQNNINHYS